MLDSEASTRASSFNGVCFWSYDQQAGQKQTLGSAYQVPEQGRCDRPRSHLHKTSSHIFGQECTGTQGVRGSVNSTPLPSLHPISPDACCFRAMLSVPNPCAIKRAPSLAESPLYLCSLFHVHPCHVAQDLPALSLILFCLTARLGLIRSFYSGSCSLS